LKIEIQIPKKRVRIPSASHEMMEKRWLAAISWKFYQARQQLVNMKNEVQSMYLAMEP